MCGRFVAFSSADEIADRLALSVISAGARLLPPNWNVAPTNQIRIVKSRISCDSSSSSDDAIAPIGTSQLELTVARWGLQTAWAQTGTGIINARIETVADKPAFANAFANRRCIIPVDGYYEWQKLDHGKQPWFITGLTNQLYFAGIYNDAAAPAAEVSDTVAIVTMPIAPELAEVHHRMPLSFGPAQFEQWLYGSAADALALVADADQHFNKWPVSAAVNSVRNNGPQLIEPTNPIAVPEQLQLFD